MTDKYYLETKLQEERKIGGYANLRAQQVHTILSAADLSETEKLEMIEEATNQMIEVLNAYFPAEYGIEELPDEVLGLEQIEESLWLPIDDYFANQNSQSK